MHPDGFKEFEKLFDLIDAGKLPHEAITRMCYFGHEVIGEPRTPIRKLKCVTCEHAWSVKENHDVSPIEYADETCPNCKTYDHVYDITGDRLVRWRCKEKECKHEWEAEWGYKCPSCGAERDTPNWDCKNCDHKWKQIEKPTHCPECGAERK